MSARPILASLAILIGLVSGCAKESSSPAHVPSDPSQTLPSVPVLAENAPKDRPNEAVGKDDVKAYEAAIQPYITKGRETYPDAKARYQKGLPKGHAFFVVANLTDSSGARERVFISVASIRDGKVIGRIANNVLAVTGLKRNDPYTVSERDVLDWVISRPDGTEEGNFIGKFQDELQKKAGGS